MMETQSYKNWSQECEAIQTTLNKLVKNEKKN